LFFHLPFSSWEMVVMTLNTSGCLSIFSYVVALLRSTKLPLCCCRFKWRTLYIVASVFGWLGSLGVLSMVWNLKAFEKCEIRAFYREGTHARLTIVS
jgi:hypothetical protein